MSAVERLKAARELIARPGGWMQGAYNADAYGTRFVSHDEAVCWCAEGAMLHVESSGVEYDFFEKAIGGDNAPYWNDRPHRTQAEVVAAFDRAIALAEAGAP